MRRRTIYIFFIQLLIVSLGIGYSYLSTSLTITSNVTVKKYEPPRYLYNEVVKENQENGLMVLDNQTSTYVTAETGIDFSVESSDTNGKGVYVRSGTENDLNPVYYYRGAVQNNNVLFAGYCWKMVRTTETGGIKLIYNGLYEHSQTRMIEKDEYINIIDDTSSYSYNDTNKNWNIEKELPGNYIIKFSVANAGNYMLNFEVSSDMSYYYFYLNDVQIGLASGGNGGQPGHINLGNITSSDIISIKFEKEEQTIDVDTLKFNVEIEEELFNCNNTGEASQIDNAVFNTNYSIDSSYNAYVGYMYGTPNANTYEEEHLSTRTSTSSNIKNIIDTWYSNNMINYTNYLEDTVWCNDRTLQSGTGVGNIVTTYGASRNSSSVNLECVNKNDRFTVSETLDGRIDGNGALTYPVALLTADEVTLAGNIFQSMNFGETNYNYLTNGNDWWTMTPSKFWHWSRGQAPGPYDNNDYVTIFGFYELGYQHSININATDGVRPSISLRHDTVISKVGDGSVNNPFVVEMQ